ncbi:redoxin domain-containing protein [Flavobacterium sp.]|jgi:peroxiredoxin|uniref:redoxin domain-containing protein n=1 Tax=Flavobacterium sp. TaxID=239 RepID=UPI0037C19A66
MKKITLFVATATLLFSCNNLKDNEFLIAGTADGVKNGKKVFIETQTETGFIAKDTAVVENGKFELKGIAEAVDLGFIRIEDENVNLPIILEEGKISVAIKTDTILNSKIGGTDNNDKFQSFNDASKVVVNKKMKFEKANLERITAAKKANDTATVNQIMKEYGKFQDDLNKVSKDFIKNNPDAYLSVLLLENFLMRQYLTAEEITSYFAKIDKSLLNTKSAKNIKKVLDAIKNDPAAKVEVGGKAPDFSAKNPEGKQISLKESMGKVTIIDFWASWCGPCRGENPNVVALYKELHAKGLNIIGVSLDKDAAKWKEAIAKDGLVWPQISNLKFWDEPIAKQYNVESIPATFILDAKGVIVARDLRGDALKAKVTELLNAK